MMYSSRKVSSPILATATALLLSTEQSKADLSNASFSNSAPVIRIEKLPERGSPPVTVISIPKANTTHEKWFEKVLRYVEKEENRIRSEGGLYSNRALAELTKLREEVKRRDEKQIDARIDSFEKLSKLHSDAQIGTTLLSRSLIASALLIACFLRPSKFRNDIEKVIHGPSVATSTECKFLTEEIDSAPGIFCKFQAGFNVLAYIIAQNDAKDAEKTNLKYKVTLGCAASTALFAIHGIAMMIEPPVISGALRWGSIIGYLFTIHNLLISDSLPAKGRMMVEKFGIWRRERDK